MSSEVPAEDKEALINERIEKIRQRNEEIQKRHREVLEDKKNADAVSALATTLDSAKPRQPPFVKKSIDKPPRERPLRTRPFIQQQPSMKQEMEQRTGNASKIYSNFADGDGPPPDPRYSFLADDERDEQRTEVRSNPGKKQSSRGRGANWNTHQAQRNSKEEKWRAERAAIDAERIQRQKTQEGNWRREWDVEKTSKELEDSGLKSSRGYQPSYRSKSKSEGGSLSWRNNSSNEAQERQSDSYPHTMIFNRNRERPVVFKAPQFRDGGHDIGARHMLLSGERMQVRIPHDSTSDSSSLIPESPASSKYSSFSAASSMDVPSRNVSNPKHNIGSEQMYSGNDGFHSDYSSMGHNSVQVDPELVERFSNIQLPHSPSRDHYKRVEDANKMTFHRNARDLTHEEDHGEESWEDVSEDEKPMHSEYGKPRMHKDDMQSAPPIATHKYHAKSPVRSLHGETKMKLIQKLSNESAASGIFEGASQNPDSDDMKDF